MLLSSLAQGGLAATLLPHGWAPWKAIFLVMGVPGLAVALLVATLREPPRRSHGEALPEGGPRLGLVALFRTYPGLFGLFFSTYTCVLIMNYALATWAPTVLMRIYGMTPKDTGFIYGSMQLVCSVSAGIFSGFVSDAIVRRRPLSGRMWIPLIGLPIQVGVIIAFILVTRVTIFIPVLAISTLVTTFISACWQPALQDLVPNQLRGRVAALMLMVGNVLGLGGAPTLVALVTDQVFHDEMKLQTSVGIVALAAGVLGLLLALGLPHACAAARRRGLGVPEPTAPVISASPAPVGVS
jgi:MFS family permease